MTPRPMNAGAEALKEALQKKGSKAELARTLGVLPDAVSKWLSGDRIPDARYRAAIEDAHPSVGWRLWDEPVQPIKTEPPARGAA